MQARLQRQQALLEQVAQQKAGSGGGGSRSGVGGNRTQLAGNATSGNVASGQR